MVRIFLVLFWKFPFFTLLWVFKALDLAEAAVFTGLLATVLGLAAGFAAGAFVAGFGAAGAALAAGALEPEEAGAAVFFCLAGMVLNFFGKGEKTAGKVS